MRDGAGLSRGVIVLALVMAGAGGVANATPSGPRWLREVGNSSMQSGNGVALDVAGDAYVAGYTYGRFPGTPRPGSRRTLSALLVKYDSRGRRSWAIQFSALYTDATSVAVDPSGDVDVAGITRGTLPGSPDANAGSDDAFVAQFTPNGDHTWTRELGSRKIDQARGVTTNSSGDVFVAGVTYDHVPGAPEPFGGGLDDGFAAKYDHDGKLIWVHQLGRTGNDEATAIAATPDGGVDVAGFTDYRVDSDSQNQGGTDSFVAHYAADGTLGRIVQFGTSSFDTAYGIAVDPNGNAFVVGSTGGSLPGSHATAEPSGDLFLVELDPAGAIERVTQLGSPATEHAYGVAVDDGDDVFVTGSTAGTIPGAPEANVGQIDAYVVRFSPALSAARFRAVWVDELGTALNDEGYAIAATSSGTATVTGYTDGLLPGATSFAGQSDVFLAQYRRSG